MKRPRPALIVFCREPIEHQVKTRLIGSMTPAAAAALSDAFIRDALAKAVSVRPARIVIAASAPDGAERSKYFRRMARQFGAELIDQGDGSLGRRMARSLEPFSSTGALLIGTDTPSLPSAMLATSLDALRRTRVVIAPSLDGGYYAVGVRGADAVRFSPQSDGAPAACSTRRSSVSNAPTFRTRSARRGMTSIDGRT